MANRLATATALGATLATLVGVGLAVPARARAAGMPEATPAGLSGARLTTTAAAAVEPISVTVAKSVARFTTRVRVTGSKDGWHHAIILAPAGDRLLEVGHGASRTSTVSVNVRLATKYLTPGTENELVVEDRITGRWSTIPLHVRRRSRLTLTHADGRQDGTVVVRGVLRHYRAGAKPVGTAAAAQAEYAPSRQSPVRVQQSVDGRWVTLKTVQTNEFGMVAAKVRPRDGAVLRLSRPIGLTVTAAQSNELVGPTRTP